MSVPRPLGATTAVVVGSQDDPWAPAARLARALRLEIADVIGVTEPDAGAVDEACAAAAARGPLRAVVHAHVPAGAAARLPLVDLDDAGWAGIVDASALATLASLQGARRHMAPGGTVLVVTPAVGLAGAAGQVALSAAGEVQRALAKSAARAWGPAGITVNVVAAAPGDIGPPGERSAVQAPALGAPAAAAGGEGPDDLVAAALLLLGAAGPGRTTGVTLVADGGATMLP